MAKTYVQQQVGAVELRDLATLAQQEESEFFVRNLHLSEPYRDRLIAAALCQGAALQLVGRGYGVADFDIHFFYRQNPSKPRLSRAVKRITANVGNFEHAPIDFVRTLVPVWLCGSHEGDAETLLKAFLAQKPTSNAKYLSQKAVVGLTPQALFGRIIWS
jgi:hypothetical protein